MSSHWTRRLSSGFVIGEARRGRVGREHLFVHSLSYLPGAWPDYLEDAAELAWMCSQRIDELARLIFVVVGGAFADFQCSCKIAMACRNEGMAF